MSMPKGYKSKHGYATVSSEYDGMDYRSIAEEMTASGDKMNHATARNIFIRAMHKIAQPLCEAYGHGTDSEVHNAAFDPRFQEGVVEIVQDIYICDTSKDGEIEI